MMLSACNTKGFFFFIIIIYVSTTANPTAAMEASVANMKLLELLPDCITQKFHCHLRVHAKFTSLDHQL